MKTEKLNFKRLTKKAILTIKEKFPNARITKLQDIGGGTILIINENRQTIANVMKTFSGFYEITFINVQ